MLLIYIFIQPIYLLTYSTIHYIDMNYGQVLIWSWGVSYFIKHILSWGRITLHTSNVVINAMQIKWGKDLNSPLEKNAFHWVSDWREGGKYEIYLGGKCFTRGNSECQDSDVDISFIFSETEI